MSRAPKPIAPELVRQLLGATLPHGAAQKTDDIDPKFLYIPTRHAEALRPDRPVVVGMRGAGKSVWWAALQSPSARSILAEAMPYLGIRADTWVSAGFGTTANPDVYPTADVMEELLEGGHRPRTIWRAVVARHTWGNNETWLSTFPSWHDRVAAIAADAEHYALATAAYDNALAHEKRVHLILFDALDRSAPRIEQRRSLLRGLLEVILDTTSFRGIKAKAFVREDMLDAASDFPDASKLVAARAELHWGVTDLYSLLWQYLGNGEGESGWFREATSRVVRQDWSSLNETWYPPALLSNDTDIQKHVFHSITGPWMGQNERRGLPYTWLPNHLSDAHRRVSPRGFLIALREAAVCASRPGWPYALHYDDVKHGVREASRVRVREIGEDIPWVVAAMEPLSGLKLPAEEAELLPKLRDRDTIARLRSDLDDATLTARDVLSRLIKIGIVYRATDGRINMPDVYRVGFGLRLKGGVAPS